jgi:hypothetical protein
VGRIVDLVLEARGPERPSAAALHSEAHVDAERRGTLGCWRTR